MEPVVKDAYIEYLIASHARASKKLKKARNAKRSIIGKRSNCFKPEDRPRHHVCFGKQYSRPWSSWSSLRLKRCTAACNLSSEAKIGYLQACWE